MKHVANNPDLSEQDWLNAFAEPILSTLRQMVASTITSALESDQTYAYFPAEWSDSDGIGNSPVENPLTVYVRIDCGLSEQPTYSFNIDDVIMASMDSFDTESSSSTYRKIADEFRKLADRIDERLRK